MKPSEKSPGMERFLEKMFKRTSSIEADICVICKQPATSFDDDLSRREYRISGMCQECQDRVFNEQD